MQIFIKFSENQLGRVTWMTSLLKNTIFALNKYYIMNVSIEVTNVMNRTLNEYDSEVY